MRQRFRDLGVSEAICSYVVYSISLMFTPLSVFLDG